jgi:hypothetical protein
MGICLSQVGKEDPVFFSVPVGEEPRNLAGMDCSLLEKFIWVLKQYPLQPQVSSVVVAVTDFIHVEFYLSDYQEIPGRPFHVVTLRYMRRLTNRQIFEQIERKASAAA